MKFGRILTALSIGLALVSPVVAKDQSSWESLAARAGCPVPVVVWETEEYGGFNAGYEYGNPTIHLLNFERMKLPESWQLYIFYHEVGHCLQWREGRINTLGVSKNPSATEWDADEYAIEKLAEHRYDGAEVQAELFAELHRLTNGNLSSDDVHGDFRERLQNGRLKRARPDVQA